MSYDPKCKELAEYFLEEYKYHSPGDVEDLAQLIQDVIEEYFDGLVVDPAE